MYESFASDWFVIYVRPRTILLIGIASMANVDIVDSIFVQVEPASGFCRLLLLLLLFFFILSPPCPFGVVVIHHELHCLSEAIK